MKIIVLAIGKSDALCKPLEEAYLKKINPLNECSLEVIKDEPQMLKRLKDNDCVWLLDPCGKTYSSEMFSNALQKTIDNRHHKRVLFLIGGPEGFSETITSRAHQTLALSAMTLTHQMVRPFLLEQIYRALQIQRGSAYHK